ncbi:hypothetical protein EniLVp02_0030 [Vibrio phage EniLVp02]
MKLYASHLVQVGYMSDTMAMIWLAAGLDGIDSKILRLFWRRNGKKTLTEMFGSDLTNMIVRFARFYSKQELKNESIPRMAVVFNGQYANDPVLYVSMSESNFIDHVEYVHSLIELPDGQYEKVTEEFYVHLDSKRRLHSLTRRTPVGTVNQTTSVVKTMYSPVGIVVSKTETREDAYGTVLMQEATRGGGRKETTTYDVAYSLGYHTTIRDDGVTELYNNNKRLLHRYVPGGATLVQAWDGAICTSRFMISSGGSVSHRVTTEKSSNGDNITRIKSIGANGANHLTFVHRDGKLLSYSEGALTLTNKTRDVIESIGSESL